MCWRMSRSGREGLRVGIWEDIPQEQIGGDQGRGEESWVRAHCAQRFSGRWSSVNSECWVITQGRGRRQRRECLLTSCHLWGHNGEIWICFQGQYEVTEKFIAKVLYWLSFSYTRTRRCVSWGSNRKAKNNHWVCWSGPGNKWQPGPGWKSQRRKAVDGLGLHFNQHHWVIRMENSPNGLLFRCKQSHLENGTIH